MLRMTLNISKGCHLGYVKLKIYNPIKFCLGHIFLTLYVLTFSEGAKTYLHFVSFLHIDTMQVVEILTQIRQEHTYST